jgi:hypothetical protein
MNSSEQNAKLAKILSDLDRCRHGRHQKDLCLDCPGGKSEGNLHLPASGTVIGYDRVGEPYTLPAEHRSYAEPDAWRPERPADG